MTKRTGTTKKGTTKEERTKKVGETARMPCRREAALATTILAAARPPHAAFGGANQ